MSALLQQLRHRPFHRSFPFEIFGRYCTGTVPQVYWNAFRWPVDQSLDWTYEDYAALDFALEQAFPAGGLYRAGIAASFGLDRWERLYDVNAGVIGGDPNRIYPGQVLVIP